MEDYQSFVIGSSNLTMSALKLNYEWNVRLTSREWRDGFFYSKASHSRMA